MKTENGSTCPGCGHEFIVALEFCPVCTLRKALSGGMESGESSASQETVEPASEQIVDRYEHYQLVLGGKDRKPVELGRGGMGITYKAMDVDLQCPVALKVIKEQYLGNGSARLRFLREARAAASVRHPNVATVFHLGRTGQNDFYAMEFVEGDTLENLIKYSRRLESKLAVEITRQVAAGLAAVHMQKLVHRDIKPSNIMVSVEAGSILTVKIIDLGLAKPAPDAPDEAAISTPGTFAGTPEFASPEQFAGVGVDIRSDLYSLGGVLWEMLTGHPVFRGTPAEVMHQHLHSRPPLEELDDVSPPAVALLEVLLEKDPARRFQSPTELLKVIPTVMRAIEAESSIKHRGPGTIPSAPSRTAALKIKAIPEPTRISKARLPVNFNSCYRLIENSNPATLGDIFHAEDNRTERRVTTDPGAIPAQSDPLYHPVPASKNHFLAVAGGLMAMLFAMVAVWICLFVNLISTPNHEPQEVAETPSQKTKLAVGSRLPPQPGKAWANSLQMRFVPLGDIHMSVWQTRRCDFEIFVEATGYDAVGGMSSAVTQNGFQLNKMSWKVPGFRQTPDESVVGVSWEDANQFCAWLTRKERSEGTLTSSQSYRLPTDWEWSRAVGLDYGQGSSLKNRDENIKAAYPWGCAFPPPTDSGNYAGSESLVDTPGTWNATPNFHDAFPRTATVSAFKANERGLCCIGGNVWEWCMDRFEHPTNWRSLRGGSWATSHAKEMVSAYRRGYGPLFRCDDVGFRCVIAEGEAP